MVGADLDEMQKILNSHASNGLETPDIEANWFHIPDIKQYESTMPVVESPREDIPSLSDAVGIEYSEEVGFTWKAQRDIMPGMPYLTLETFVKLPHYW